MFGFLTFHSAIRLSQVSQYFHHGIKPQNWPDEAKADFIEEAQNWKIRYTISIFHHRATRSCIIDAVSYTRASRILETMASERSTSLNNNKHSSHAVVIGDQLIKSVFGSGSK